MKIKAEELTMKSKEVEMLHNTFERKYATFDARNREIQEQLEIKEKELLEEKLHVEELESEITRYKEE